MNFYKHHIGDYAAATSHLSILEDGAYSRLLRIYYRDESPLPVDTKAVQRLAGARSKDERDAVQVVLEEFFELEDDGWHNKRADEEIARASSQAETNRRIAEEREAKRRATKPARTEHESCNESLASREPSQTPDTRQEQGIASQSKGAAQKAALPPWLDTGAWGDWHAFRNSRKGWTARARDLSLRTLTQLHDAGHDPRAVIEQSIERGWTGLFPVHEGGARAGPNGQQPMGKQMQGLMALEDLKRGARERMGTDRDRGGAAETRLLVVGSDAGR